MENIRYMISDAANIVNVESHVLRYWEEELELQIPRNEMGHRYYTEENIAQFQKIKEWKEQGYQLKAIRMMIHSNISGQNPENYNEVFMESKLENHGETVISRQPENYDRRTAVQNKTITENNNNNVVHMNPEYLEQNKKPLPEKSNNSALNAVKLEQFQSMMLTIVKRAVEENNQALGQEVGTQVGERVLKEMNYLMREQEEAEEERFRKLDDAIRTHHKTKRFHREKKEKNSKKLLGKDKKLNPNVTV